MSCFLLISIDGRVSSDDIVVKTSSAVEGTMLARSPSLLPRKMFRKSG